MDESKKEYWEKLYAENDTGWDIGSVSPPLKEYIDQLENKDLKIAIPGAGNGHEFRYLWQSGFKNIYAIDIASAPLDNIKRIIPKLPDGHLIKSDFFALDMEFDLILEQTFFCALPPSFRAAYTKKMFELLKKGGKLSGLLFKFPLTEEGPPYGGSEEEYRRLFNEHFDILLMEECNNSIPQRQGNELFMKLQKKV